MKTRENMRTVKLFSSFKTTLFEHISKEKSAHSLLGAWSFLLVNIRFTPSVGPKDFVYWYFWETGPWMLEHGKGPSSMIRLHGPWCKLALSDLIILKSWTSTGSSDCGWFSPFIDSHGVQITCTLLYRGVQIWIVCSVESGLYCY